MLATDLLLPGLFWKDILMDLVPMTREQLQSHAVRLASSGSELGRAIVALFAECEELRSHRDKVCAALETSEAERKALLEQNADPLFKGKMTP